MNSKPSVVTKPMSPMRSSISWLVATVVPCDTAATSGPAAPTRLSALWTAAMNPSAGSAGVDGVLLVAISPVASSKATTSVNVPPVSMPIRMRMAPRCTRRPRPWEPSTSANAAPDLRRIPSAGRILCRGPFGPPDRVGGARTQPIDQARSHLMALERPEIDFPEGTPPANLDITDIVVGDGQEATPGAQVPVHYVGVSFSTGEDFDASWNRGQPFEFPLGGKRVIAGWDLGVKGMKVGGRRKLVIPPHLGYGNRGAGNAIKPGETLIFIVDLLAVN